MQKWIQRRQLANFPSSLYSREIGDKMIQEREKKGKEEGIFTGKLANQTHDYPTALRRDRRV